VFALHLGADVLRLPMCRQIAGDGEALAEVAFFTEIVQMESVRSITVAKACSIAISVLFPVLSYLLTYHIADL
jgi:hypothetical protein